MRDFFRGNYPYLKTKGILMISRALWLNKAPDAGLVAIVTQMRH